MEIRQLQYFMAVAEQLSFSKAAALLYVTQPLLSQQVADLERQLGAELFTRNRRNVALTPAGAALYREASGILTQMNRAAHAVRNAADGVGLAGSLTIGFEYIFPRVMLTDAVSAFRLDYPQVEVQVNRYSVNQLLYMFNKEKLDLAFFTLPFVGLDRNCSYRILERNQLAVAASRYLAAEPTLACVKKAMETHPIYQMDNDTRGLAGTMQVCSALGIVPQFYFSDSLESLLSCVESGMGTAILAKNILRSYGSAHLITAELDGINGASVCSAAVWLKSNGNPLIPLLLDYIAADAGACDGKCGKPCVFGEK